MDKEDGTPNYAWRTSLRPNVPHPNRNSTRPTTWRLRGDRGFGVEELAEKFKADHDDYNSIMTKALADRLAEAFAEYLHQRAREGMGLRPGREPDHRGLIAEKYRGIRPAAGYPACPDHTEKGFSGSCSTWRRTPASS